MNALVMSLAACASTLAGGLLALAWRDRLRGVPAFSAGTLLGVVAWHLLPESVELAQTTGRALPLTGLAALAGLASLQAIGKGAHRHAGAAAGCRTRHGRAGRGATGDTRAGDGLPGRLPAAHHRFFDLLPRLFKGGIATLRRSTAALLGCGVAFAALLPHGG